ncbi:MaoC family dehydratase [Cupriavidus sp. a3]|uniref:MaoC family dehydratase n=1 Tax=Cupriavidus sp. a3 TaxID=3242158 RepID=UPI003D9C3FD8
MLKSVNEGQIVPGEGASTTMNRKLRLSDIKPGLRYVSPGIVVTESHIVNFAGLSGDFFDVHMDDAFARSVGFKARVAHGLLCLSLVDGLKNRSTLQFDAIASLEWTYRFRKPVYVGDRIEAHMRVLEARPTSNPSTGVVRLQLQVINQHGDIVQDGVNALMVKN